MKLGLVPPQQLTYYHDYLLSIGTSSKFSIRRLFIFHHIFVLSVKFDIFAACQIWIALSQHLDVPDMILPNFAGSNTWHLGRLFCSTSLPLASTRWAWLTLSSQCPLFLAVPSINISNIKREILGKVKNRTLGRWVQARTCAMRPPLRQNGRYLLMIMLVFASNACLILLWVELCW